MYPMFSFEKRKYSFNIVANLFVDSIHPSDLVGPEVPSSLLNLELFLYDKATINAFLNPIPFVTHFPHFNTP
jgi:hypothetical protein